VQLNKTGNSCGLLSAETTLTILSLPVVNNNHCSVWWWSRCCNDFQFNGKNNEISTNAANENFTYYTTFNGATTADNTTLIYETNSIYY
jgi:hypothetical protein